MFPLICSHLVILCSMPLFGKDFIHGDIDTYCAHGVLTFLHTGTRYCTLSGLMGLASIGGYIEQAAKAKAAAGGLYSVIDHVPLINGLDEGGLSPKGVKTGISFNNVTFAYPSSGTDGNSEKAITRNAINNLSFTVGMGETVGVIGRSGSGKSTIANLLHRLYDPQEGTYV